LARLAPFLDLAFDEVLADFHFQRIDGRSFGSGKT
jgi:hypothetical protein